ncbi:glutamine--fructose-6-phosphate transaminase (isomerizing) [candidate division TA06 bacterium]|uniref:Glutamine--fructose-6-phosphate aminotransferase [isomerizing] n=1 Tax=candidate division TA06 bacterium TaxID=2250710 RepID=A0A523UY53_UNCT6|nr:MAG: glutamine--fructose-6-phosphate transaminase (isomerizing) [candidate division TA06 bacterium]
MCGIVGYIGKSSVVPILMEGLRRLEYRGYDSAGIAILANGKMSLEKKVGKVAVLEPLAEKMNSNSTIGIAHTRWATHGEPTDANAHPHTDCKDRIAVAHNGIIENYRALKRLLEDRGHTFKTDTDTEVLAHLIEENYNGDLLEAVRYALNEVEGTYGIVVLSLENPRQLVAARNGSPLVVGVGDSEYIVASDVAAILRHTKQVVYLEDGELASVTDEGVQLTTLQEEAVEPKIHEVTWTLGEIEKGGYDHFMLKEICEQPQTLKNAFRGRLDKFEWTARLGGLSDYLDQLQRVKRIILTACGTAWHAALIGEYMLEEIAEVVVEVEYASELRYRSPIIDEETLLFAISQSGETTDTLAALREVKRRGAPVFGIVNVVGSTVARETDAGVYIHAGPEIGVASTKAFTSQVMVLALISLLLGRMRGLSPQEGRNFISALQKIPSQVSKILDSKEKIEKLASDYCDVNNFLFLGRGYNFPVALEGALKMKEISYIHAEGYPAAEMKHGPIALIDQNMPVVFIAIRDGVYEKVLSNIAEVKARRGRVIAIATEGDREIGESADHVIYVPETLPSISPLLTVIPLQLLAYYVALKRNCDVDKPRNLAKSVTVE